MTEKHNMKWAIELAIASMENPDANLDRKYLAMAADMLRNGGPVVEKCKEFNFMCTSCGELYGNPVQYCTECVSGSWSIERLNIPRTMKWTVREKIKIITAESKITFEEIK